MPIDLDSEIECCDYYVENVLGGVIICHKCNSTNNRRFNNNPKFRRCSNCYTEFSILKNSLIRDTNLPLNKWFKAIWYFINSETLIIAKELQRELKFGNYGTALKIIKLIRENLIVANDKLIGKVFIDKIELGGKKKQIYILAIRQEHPNKIKLVECSINQINRKFLKKIILNKIDTKNSIIKLSTNLNNAARPNGFINSSIYREKLNYLKLLYEKRLRKIKSKKNHQNVINEFEFLNNKIKERNKEDLFREIISKLLI